MIYTFGEWELDTELYELCCAKKPVGLQPQVFNVLAYLVRHCDRVVSKQELLSRLWPDQYIGDSALERCIMTARKAIGDSGAQQRIIKTFHRRGYRFMAPITEHTPPLAKPSQPQGCVPHASGWGSQSGKIAQPSSGSPQSNGAENGHDTSGPRRAAGSYDPECKQVTVLSCALANVRQLAEQCGPEAFHSLLERFFDRAARYVQGYEGMIVPYMGDGFVGLFGAREDHAVRAVQVALELQDRLSEDQVGRDLPSKNLALRIGLHTGHVIDKRFGDDPRMIYMAVGDTMQFAANLQACADPESILVSEVTYRLVREVVYGEIVALVAVEAKSLPMAAYKVYQMHSPLPAETSPTTPHAVRV